MPEVMFSGRGRIEAAFTRRQCVARRSRSSYIRIRNSADDEQSNRLQSLLHFRRARIFVLRFNFRASAIASGFDHGQASCRRGSRLDWAQAFNPEARSCWIAGISFGAGSACSS